MSTLTRPKSKSPMRKSTSLDVDMPSKEQSNTQSSNPKRGVGRSRSFGLARIASSDAFAKIQRPGLQRDSEKRAGTLRSLPPRTGSGQKSRAAVGRSLMASMRNVTGSRRKRSSTSSTGKEDDASLNIFASDIVSIDFVLGRIGAVKVDTNIVKVEIEDMIISSNFQEFYPVVRDLLASADREWVSVSFIDTIPLDEYEKWKSWKKKVVSSINKILYKPVVEGCVPLNSQVITLQANLEVNAGTSLESFVSLMQNLRTETGICSVKFAGALFMRSSLESMLEALAECINETNELSEMIGIQIACGWKEDSDWAKRLDNCIQAAKNLSDWRAAKERIGGTPSLKHVRSAGALSSSVHGRKQVRSSMDPMSFSSLAHTMTNSSRQRALRSSTAVDPMNIANNSAHSLKDPPRRHVGRSKSGPLVRRSNMSDNDLLQMQNLRKSKKSDPGMRLSHRNNNSAANRLVGTSTAVPEEKSGQQLKKKRLVSRSVSMDPMSMSSSWTQSEGEKISGPGMRRIRSGAALVSSNISDELQSNVQRRNRNAMSLSVSPGARQEALDTITEKKKKRLPRRCVSMDDSPPLSCRMPRTGAASPNRGPAGETLQVTPARSAKTPKRDSRIVLQLPRESILDQAALDATASKSARPAPIELEDKVCEPSTQFGVAPLSSLSILTSNLSSGAHASRMQTNGHHGPDFRWDKAAKDTAFRSGMLNGDVSSVLDSDRNSKVSYLADVVDDVVNRTLAEENETDSNPETDRHVKSICGDLEKDHDTPCYNWRLGTRSSKARSRSTGDLARLNLAACKKQPAHRSGKQSKRTADAACAE